MGISPQMELASERNIAVERSRILVDIVVIPNHIKTMTAPLE